MIDRDPIDNGCFSGPPQLSNYSYVGQAYVTSENQRLTVVDVPQNVSDQLIERLIEVKEVSLIEQRRV